MTDQIAAPRQRPGNELPVAIRFARRDVLISLLLFTASILYLVSLPLRLGPPDEAHQLHEAVRILTGEIPYRDFFDLILPGWMYLMAAAFGLFGTTLATARTVAAVIHGAIAAAVFVACRRADVRRGLSCAAGLACLAVCEPVYAVASQHWLATFLSTVLLVLCLHPRQSMLRAAGAGVVIGVLISVHQQRGLSIGAGVAVFLIVDAVVTHGRRGSAVALGAIGGRLAALTSGTLLVILPMLGALVMRAGFEPVWHDLVVVPLVNYRGAIRCPWGFSAVDAALPRILRTIPIALAISFTVAVVSWLRGLQFRALIALVVLGAASVVSIYYYPDYIHLAFIAPVFVVALAESVERALRILPRLIDVAVGGAIALVVATAAALYLKLNLVTAMAAPRIAYESAFGRVELGPAKKALYTNLDRLLRDAPSRTVYAHPISGYTYLLLGARNPTRFEFVLAGSYHDSAQVKEVLEDLARADVPYVVLEPGTTRPDDPIARYIRDNYEPVRTRPIVAGWIWRKSAPRPLDSRAQ